MTARLAGFAVGNWPEVDGTLKLEAGIDLLDLPLDRAVNILYTMLMRNRDEKERAKMESDLTKPLAGEYVRQDDKVWGEEAQGAAFLAALNAKNTEGGEE